MFLKKENTENIFCYKIVVENFSIEKYWAVVEEFIFPESFVSLKGNFMLKIKEDEKKFLDKWLLVEINDKNILINFLKGKINYNEFLSYKENKFYILIENLNDYKIYFEKEEKWENIKNKLKNILSEKIFIENKNSILKIIKYFEKYYFNYNFL